MRALFAQKRAFSPPHVSVLEKTAAPNLIRTSPRSLLGVNQTDVARDVTSDYYQAGKSEISSPGGLLAMASRMIAGSRPRPSSHYAFGPPHQVRPAEKCPKNGHMFHEKPAP
jgi:hypothetical protein